METLSLYTKVYHKHFSVESLSAGLPKELGKSDLELFSVKDSKSLFTRASLNAGLKSKLIEIDLHNISTLQLPMILLLSSKESCIIDSLSEDKSRAKIITSDNQDILEQWVNLDELNKNYLGFSYMIKKIYKYENEQTNTLKIDQKHWFFSTIKLSKNIYKDVFLASILINLFILATPLFTMSVYDRVIPNNSIETLTVFAVGVLVVYIIDFISKYIRSTLLEVAAKKSDVIISSIIFEKVMDIKMSSFPSSVGSFANNLKDFDTLRSFFTNSTLTALIDFPFAILFLSVIYYIGGNIVIVPLTTIVILLIFALLIKGPIQKYIEELHQVSAQKSSIIVESLQNIETLKTLGMSSHMQWSWEETVGQSASIGLKSRILSSLIPNVTSFFMQLNSVLVVVYGVFLIKDFELTMGGLIAVVILTSRVLAPMGQATGLITNYEDAKTSYKIIDDIINLPSERAEASKYVEYPSFEGDIEFKNVSFAYPGTDVLVLNDVSFSIKSGERVGIIGRIGSGKSTIEKLILRLYEPTEGTILLDGIDINQINPADLRRNIGYVSQEIQLFKGTLRDNIIYRASYASDEELKRSSKISGVEEFVKRHPLGFDMPIGERGTGISGGQKQAIGIARSFLYNVSIMLFDEPSNAMDQLTENNLINSFKKNLRGKTALVVTQKMSMLEVVERVIVMSEGRVYLDGKKADVIKALQGGKSA
ncbi:type I secretion system permease/ATPase [Sulfurimonas aquatica]|uniref:type I secretion system permease/ATPase n=1 Tax=Sulfurimonas aquatica TaxID=2672570 RepID=UPI003242DB23